MKVPIDQITHFTFPLWKSGRAHGPGRPKTKDAMEFWGVKGANKNVFLRFLGLGGGPLGIFKKNVLFCKESIGYPVFRTISTKNTIPIP